MCWLVGLKDAICLGNWGQKQRTLNWSVGRGVGMMKVGWSSEKGGYFYVGVVYRTQEGQIEQEVFCIAWTTSEEIETHLTTDERKTNPK